MGGNIAFFCYSGKAIGKVDKLKEDEKGENDATHLQNSIFYDRTFITDAV